LDTGCTLCYNASVTRVSFRQLGAIIVHLYVSNLLVTFGCKAHFDRNEESIKRSYEDNSRTSHAVESGAMALMTHRPDSSLLIMAYYYSNACLWRNHSLILLTLTVTQNLRFIFLQFVHFHCLSQLCLFALCIFEYDFVCILTDNMNSGKPVLKRADVILQNAFNRIQQQPDVLVSSAKTSDKENATRHSSRKRVVSRRLLFDSVITCT